MCWIPIISQTGGKVGESGRRGEGRDAVLDGSIASAGGRRRGSTSDLESTRYEGHFFTLENAAEDTAKVVVNDVCVLSKTSISEDAGSASKSGRPGQILLSRT